MPRESDQKLLERVQEMKLLCGISSEEADVLKKALLHPGSRLAAEIGFLPDTPEEEVEALRAWLEEAELRCAACTRADAAADPDDSVPGAADCFAPSSSLAALNGAAAMLPYWPVSTAERACTACRSIVSLLGQIRAETVQEEINRDRAAAGHQPEESLPAVASCLRDHREAILSDMAERCMEALAPCAFRRLRTILAEQYCKEDSRYFRSQILDELVCRHLGHAGAAEADYHRTEAVRVMQTYRAAEAGRMSGGSQQGSGKTSAVSPAGAFRKEAQRRERQCAKLLEHLQMWNTLTKPERMITRCKGYMDQAAEQLMKQVNDCSVFMVNTCGDYKSGRAVLGSMEELFFDMPQDVRMIVRENKKKLHVADHT